MLEGGGCDPSPAVGKATKSTTAAANGTTVIYTCLNGHKLNSGNNVQTTTCDGTYNRWSPPVETQCWREFRTRNVFEES